MGLSGERPFLADSTPRTAPQVVDGGCCSGRWQRRRIESANLHFSEMHMESPTPQAKHTISISRMAGMTWRSRNSLGQDAKHAVMFMPGAFSVEIQSETAEVAVVRYEWHAPQPFARTAAHLAERGLRRVDWL